MTVEEVLLEKMKVLPMKQKQEVLDFAEFLGRKENPRSPRRSRQGSLAHLNIKFAESDLREAGDEMWRVLTTDPGMGVIRHADAGYEEAINFAQKNNVKIPMDE